MGADEYAEMSDEELIRIIREDESRDGAVRSRATDYLMEKYKNLVRSRAKSMYILGGSTEDLIQEGMIGLFKAIRDYDCGRDASFRTFAALCVSRKILTAVQADGRLKNKALNNAISLYSVRRTDADENGEGRLIDLVGENGKIGPGAIPEDASDSFNPETRIIADESLRLLLDRIDEALSPLESEVMGLFLTGMDYVEIAHVLNRDEKSTDNALQRSKTKIRRILADRNTNA